MYNMLCVSTVGAAELTVEEQATNDNLQKYVQHFLHGNLIFST